MFHFYFKWRYERKARANALELPKSGRDKNLENANFGSYLSRTSGASRSFRPYERQRRRRKIMQFTTTLLLVAFVAWVTYESLVALAIIGK
ncbi:MAG: hypothetical protein ACPGSB_05330 [Opitutales bacterium]